LITKRDEEFLTQKERPRSFSFHFFLPAGIDLPARPLS
jgi:hypothetical protein